MAFLKKVSDICGLREDARNEALVWQRNYPEYQRLADNEIIDDLDEALPEVNDGTLAASLFKLPKRIVNSDLTGHAKATDRDDAWVTELANIVWEEKIIPNANSQAPFHRKWKDAVRKAAIYGHVPLITLFVERGSYIGSDFIVGQPGDVLLEAGKVSDYDSDLMFWEVYYSKLQLEGLIERAKTETKEAKDSKTDGYNKWNIPELQRMLAEYQEEEKEPRNGEGSDKPRPKGVKFSVVVQRGVEAPFFMINDKKKAVREWSNPDPSGDLPIHFLYCYQDFENPYGIGIAKLAGGTQNVLDYFRQADVLATQLGFRPPVSISGDTTGLDLDSLVYAQDAQWILGKATVKREEISNQIYGQLPGRINMYKSSLNNLLPMGDTSISAEAGDPLQSKTPAGVKLAAANLSIDDDDFKDNLYVTYEAKARSMINTHFANMQGTDLMKLSDEHRDLLAKSGLEFPTDEEGNPTNELEIIWDEARANFTWEMDAEQDKVKDDEKNLEGLLRVAEFRASDPTFDQKLMTAGYKINDGELFGSIIKLTTDNKKILEEVEPEDKMAMEEGIDPLTGQPIVDPNAPQVAEEQPLEQPEQPAQDLIPRLMEEFGVDEQTAQFMLAAEQQGYEPQEILETLQRNSGVPANA